MNSLSGHTGVALFVRVPVPGRVKTRLASDLGDDVACSLYKAMVTDVLRSISTSGFPMYLFHDGVDSGELPEEWLRAASKVIAQAGGNIGDRMATAFEHCFAETMERVVLVGSDIPGLDSRIIVSASAALEFHDVAIAPAADGGYCLIAMKKENVTLSIFRDIPWSTGQVLRATLERCRECDLQVALLETLQDIDTIEDLKEYRRNRAINAITTNHCLEAVGSF